MNKKILILGKGFIGERLQKELSCRIDGTIINNFNDAQKLINRFKPKILINCIGITGKRNVDDCELEKDATLLANSFVPIILAEVCLRNNIKLVHISSGCIYEYDYKENKPIKEEDLPNFFGLFYSRSKIYSERALGVLSKKYNILILRIRIPLLNVPHPKNLLDKLIRYKKVIDVPNSITYIPDFIKATKYLLSIEARGIYNMVNKGALKYKDLMNIYKNYIPNFEYKIISLKNLKLVRSNLILSTRKLERSGFKVRSINSVLEECVKEYIKY